MAKFKIKIGEKRPDFPLPITFNTPDGEEATIILIMKHVSQSELNEMINRDEMSNLEFIKEMASGWKLEEDFNDENISWVASNYPAFVIAIPQTYLAALAGHRAKN